jgi:hypothetical protein
MTDTLTLDRLNTILTKAGIDDHEIIGGVEFSHVGYQKLAAQMGTNLSGIQTMINALMTKLRDEQHHMSETYGVMVNEDNERYSMEDDFLGNVTIRDSQTGDETYLEGSMAAELLHALTQGADKQETLAHYVDIKSDHINEAAEDGTYEDEIDGSKGTYNFPWKSSKGHGTATAEYSGKNKINVISIRDQNGDEVAKTPDLDAELLRQAIAFIGDA